MRAVVDGCDQRRFQQGGLALGGQLAAQHQPDHFGKTDLADQLLDRVAAYVDAAGFDVDDVGAPVIGSEAGGVLCRCGRHDQMAPSARKASIWSWP